LIIKLLNKDPEKRVDAKDIKKHEFFKGINWEMLKRKEYKSSLKLEFDSNIDVRYFNKEFTDKIVDENVVPAYIAADQFVVPQENKFKASANNVPKKLRPNLKRPMQQEIDLSEMGKERPKRECKENLPKASNGKKKAAPVRMQMSILPAKKPRKVAEKSTLETKTKSIKKIQSKAKK
jgi:serine/threonine protein kinase